MLYYVSWSSITFTNSCEQYVVKQLYLVMSTVMKWWAMAHQMRTMKTVGSKAIVRETQPTYTLWWYDMVIRNDNMANVKVNVEVNMQKVFLWNFNPADLCLFFSPLILNQPSKTSIIYKLKDSKLWGLGPAFHKVQQQGGHITTYNLWPLGRKQTFIHIH